MKTQLALSIEFNQSGPRNWKDGKHYWLTPPDLYAALDAEFHFDFDPCPYPRPLGFDGLAVEWGQSNYVNPPFGRGAVLWARKAVEEKKRGHLSVLVYPSNLAMACLLTEISDNIRDLGRVRWLACEDREPAHKHHCFLILAFVLRP